MPVYPLYAIASGNPDPTLEDLKVLANGFTLVQGGFSKEAIDTLHRINPDFRAVNYVNSSYTTNPEQVPLVEGEFRDALNMFPAAELADHIDVQDTEFKLKTASGNSYESIALKGSTLKGEVSSGDPDRPSTQFFVTWIQIGDEYMRIEEFDSRTNHIKVTRGFDGTQPQKHARGDIVFSPVYLGSQNLTGAYPGGPGDKLRYAFDPGKQESGKWIARLAEGIMKTGFDGIWLDIMSSSAFNLADSEGRKVQAWNFKNNRYYTPEEFRLGQEIKVNVIQRTIHEELGIWPVLVANNMQAKNFEMENGGLRKLLESTSIKPRPLDGYCIEGFAGGFFANMEERMVSGLEYHTGELWEENVKMLMKCAQQHLSAFPMASKAGSKSLLIEPWGKDRDEFELYAYSSYLLAVETDFATPLGIPVFYQKDGKRYAYLNPQYFWPIGAPKETVSPEHFEDYRKKGQELYLRHFENGIVMVNPTNEDQTRTLNNTYADPRNGSMVKTITMPPHTGRILLKE